MVVVTVMLYALGFVVLLVLTQDLQIFPGVAISKLNFRSQRNKVIPPGVKNSFILTADGKRLEIWRYGAFEESKDSGHVAIIFHGNGGPVENFFFAQLCLGEIGITSYSFDYRGFGRSSGWPTEHGMYLDCEAVWKYVVEQEGADPSRLIAVGISVGAAAAARMAAQEHPKILLLASAFTDIKSVIRAQPLLGLLARFCWYTFPTEECVKKLKSTHMLLLHGTNDTIVPYSHAKKLQTAYRGNGSVVLHTSDIAGHNSIFFALKEELKETLRGWM